METMNLPDIALRGPYLKSTDHIHDELTRIELLVRAQVVRWRLSSACVGPERDWGMVVVSQDEVDHYLKSPVETPGTLPAAVWKYVKPWWDQAEQSRSRIDKHCETQPSSDLRLKALARLFDLSSAERDILLLCLLAESDDRYRRLFGYLQNDASRQTLSVELITQVLRGILPSSGKVRDLFSPFGNLLRHHLLVVGVDAASVEALPLRNVRIDDRIASYLLDSDVPDNRLSGILQSSPHCTVEPIYVREEARGLLEQLPESLYFHLEEAHENVRLFLSGPDARLAAKVARSLSAALQLPLLEFDVAAALRSSQSFELLIDLAYREARLTGAALFIHSAEPILAADADRFRWEYLQAAAAAFSGLTIAAAESLAIPVSAVSDAHFWIVDLPLPDYQTRKVLWLTELPLCLDSSHTEDQRERLASDLASAFQTTEAQIEDALSGASNLARRESPFASQIAPNHLFEACRRQTGKRLVAFAQRIEPRPSLSVDDVILPEPNKRQLLDLHNRIHFHRELLSRSGLDHSMRLGKGILALFAGSSGTGKTMSAEVLASSQGVDLYRVDLSAVVSKWIGETEKNLSRIFSEAESSNGWLFFDEGESLFGSRGDIKQAQDRLLNLEVNYLLQRIEEFSGVVILATNLRNNIDDAFLRRIHAVVEFPQPNARFRVLIWKKLLPPAEQRDFDDQHLRKIAGRFEISGGNIRNVVLDAMFRSYGAQSRLLTLRHVVDGVAREFQKLGRPILAPDFGEQFYPWVVEDILDPHTAVSQAGD
jgi:hypothetical protein